MSELKELRLAAASLALIGFFFGAVGCGQEGEGQDFLETVTAAVITGGRNIGPTTSLQSETIGTSDRNNHQYFGYNSPDTVHLTFPDSNTRKICRGMTEMGWSMFVPSQNQWTFGSIAPPSGYAVLWGDPAITTFPANPTTANQTVFLSNLAAPNANFNQADPLDGVMDDCITDPSGLELLDRHVLAGACIARTQAGSFFTSLSSSDCFGEQNGSPSATPTDFYDGGSIDASATAVYAAYFNATLFTAPLWRATTTTSFSRVAVVPFSHNVQDHPIVVSSGGSFVYVIALVAQTNNPPQLELVAYDETKGTFSSPISLTNDYSSNDVSLHDGTLLREVGYTAVLQPNPQAPPFLFIFYPSLPGPGSVKQIHGISCTINSNLPNGISCARGPGWDRGATGVNTFMPAAASREFGVQFGAAKTWLTYWQESASNPGMVSLMGFDGTNNDPVPLTPPQRPCPYGTSSGGIHYWGDYDGMAVTMNGTIPVFTRAIADSTGAACVSQKFTASPQHVSAVTFSLSSFRIALQTSDHVHYLTAEGDGSGTVSADRTAIGAWEVFEIEDLSGKSTLNSGDLIHIRHDSSSGQDWYGTADAGPSGSGGGGGPDSRFRTNRTQAASWETFTILKSGGGTINNGDNINFLSVNSFYMSATGGGGMNGDGSVTVDQTQASTKETFKVLFQ